MNKCQVINLLKQDVVGGNLGCIFTRSGCLITDLKILFKEILDPFASVFLFFREKILDLEQYKHEEPFPKAESK